MIIDIIAGEVDGQNSTTYIFTRNDIGCTLRVTYSTSGTSIVTAELLTENDYRCNLEIEQLKIPAYLLPLLTKEKSQNILSWISFRSGV